MIRHGRHSPISPLTPDEELVFRAQCGNRRAEETLVARYRGYVVSRAHEFFLQGAEMDDVIQEGMIGLCKAVRDFRAPRAICFRAFAVLCIRRHLITAVKSARRHKHAPLNSYYSLYQRLQEDLDGDILLDCLPDNQAVDPLSHLLSQTDFNYLFDPAQIPLSPLEAGVLEGFLQGKTYRQMARELYSHGKAIDNALQRARRKISDAATSK